MNPYSVLSVERNATLKNIKSAYRTLSQEYHPDKPGGDRAKFEEIKLAYDVLSNPERRKRYDETGRIDESPVTPEAVRQMIAQTVRAIVTAQRPDGSTDDPDWDDVKQKVLLTIYEGRRQVEAMRRETERKLKRTEKLLKRFKSKTDEDPVGDALRDAKKDLEAEMRQHEDALEMSRKLEEAFKQYDYEVGPGPEGQFSPGPPLRRRTMFLSGSSTVIG
jgi:curved DNA-binding protein CbpA